MGEQWSTTESPPPRSWVCGWRAPASRMQSHGLLPSPTLQNTQKVLKATQQARTKKVIFQGLT